MRAPAPTGSLASHWRPLAACLLCAPAIARSSSVEIRLRAVRSQLPGGAPPSANFVGTPGGPFTPFQNCALAGRRDRDHRDRQRLEHVRILVRLRPGDARRLRRIAGDLRARLRLGPANDHTARLRTGLADELQHRHPAALPRPQRADLVQRRRSVLDPDELRRQRRAMQRRADHRRPRPRRHPGRRRPRRRWRTSRDRCWRVEWFAATRPRRGGGRRRRWSQPIELR